MSAVVNRSTLTPGATLQATRNTSTWRTSTEMPVRISERGPTKPRTSGRMMALIRAITMTTTTASKSLSTVMPGRSHAVSQNETAATMRVIRSRLTRATFPPRHSQSTRAWVL